MRAHSASLALGFSMIGLIGCKQEQNLEEFKWLLGKWKGSMQAMDVHEYWTLENESSFSGEGYVLSETDTLFHEFTKLRAENGEVFYIADVPGNPAPVSFKLTSKKPNQAVFENPGHDFPKKITYSLVAADSLIALVQGDENGKFRKEEFHFKKIN